MLPLFGSLSAVCQADALKQRSFGVRADAGVYRVLHKDSWFSTLPFQGMVPGGGIQASLATDRSVHALSLSFISGNLSIEETPSVSLELGRFEAGYVWGISLFGGRLPERWRLEAGPAVRAVWETRRYVGFINAGSVSDARFTVDATLGAAYHLWRDMSGRFRVDLSYSLVNWYGARYGSDTGGRFAQLEDRNGFHFPFFYKGAGIRAGYYQQLGIHSGIGLAYAWGGFSLASAYPVSEEMQQIRLTYQFNF